MRGGESLSGPLLLSRFGALAFLLRDILFFSPRSVLLVIQSLLFKLFLISCTDGNLVCQERGIFSFFPPIYKLFFLSLAFCPLGLPRRRSPTETFLLLSPGNGGARSFAPLARRPRERGRERGSGNRGISSSMNMTRTSKWGNDICDWCM